MAVLAAVGLRLCLSPTYISSVVASFFGSGHQIGSQTCPAGEVSSVVSWLLLICTLVNTRVVKRLSG
jgi:hypothetical protein